MLFRSDDRYVVEMPFKPEIAGNPILGNSKDIAAKRLNSLWKRLESDATMRALYSEFLSEYHKLSHIKKLHEDIYSDEGYYLPHHGVLKPSSTTTKLRVVFNATAKSSNGKSLNDLLCKGGVLQDDIFSIMIRFRKHTYAFSADIQKMFRQIEINPKQTNYQRILWKADIMSPIQVYELKTVTYGTACAPYLATKVLQQLALDERKDFPLASNVLLHDVYMDDCLSGSSDINEFHCLTPELTKLLLRGGMSLHKWCTNLAPSAESQVFRERKGWLCG